jgi:hypothetical protein
MGDRGQNPILLRTHQTRCPWRENIAPEVPTGGRSHRRCGNQSPAQNGPDDARRPPPQGAWAGRRRHRQRLRPTGRSHRCAHPPAAAPDRAARPSHCANIWRSAMPQPTAGAVCRRFPSDGDGHIAPKGADRAQRVQPGQNMPIDHGSDCGGAIKANARAIRRMSQAFQITDQGSAVGGRHGDPHVFHRRSLAAMP